MLNINNNILKMNFNENIIIYVYDESKDSGENAAFQFDISDNNDNGLLL